MFVGGQVRSSATATTGEKPPTPTPTMAEEMARLRSQIPKPSVEEDKQDFGFLYANLDANGKTTIDRIYEGRQESAMRALLAPIAPPEDDGSVRPDFAVGLQQYHHSLRGAYREAIAKSLDVSPQQVRLSVAWSARYDVSSFFKGVRKVLGVTLVSAKDPSRRLLGVANGNDDEGGPMPEIRCTSKDYDLWRQRIVALVRSIKSLSRSDLVALHITQATATVSEVKSASESTALVISGQAHWELPADVDKELFTDALIEATISIREALRVYAAVVVHSGKRVYPVGVGNSSLYRNQNGQLQTVAEFIIPAWRHQLQKCHVIPAVIDMDNLAESLDGLNIGYTSDRRKRLLANTDSRHHSFVGKLWECKVMSEVTGGKVGIVKAADGPRFNMPLMFINGAFVGGVSEMAYLASNSKAFRTMVLHPDDIELKAHLLRKAAGGRTKLVTRAEHIGMNH